MVQAKSQHTRPATTTAICAALACVSLACSRESRFDSKASELERGAAGSGDGTPAKESEEGRGNDNGQDNGKDNGGAKPGDSDGSGNTVGDKDAPSKSTEGPGSDKDAEAGNQTGISGLLKLPNKPGSMNLEPNTPALENLACQQTFELKALSKDGSVSPDSVRWASSNSRVVTIDSKGAAKVVGSGTVTLVAVGRQEDGTEVQDSIELTIAPAFTNFRVFESEAIKQVTTPSRTQKGSEAPVFVPGLVRGRIRLLAAADNIDLQSVTATVHSSDFTQFVFSEFTTPKHDPAMCAYFVEFKMEFTNFFVADVTKYTDQVLKVDFQPTTKREEPHRISWSAILVPVGVTVPNPPVVNEGTGTQGFSTDPAASSP